MSQSETPVSKNVLERRFNPANWQWEENGKVYPLESLSREDLLQAVCACMQTIEQLDDLQLQLGAICYTWRCGEILPADNSEPPLHG